MTIDESRLTWHESEALLVYAADESGAKTFDMKVAKAFRLFAKTHSPMARRLQVRFDDRAAAAHNADALSFLGIEAAYPKGVVVAEAAFTARDDFGI